MKKLLETILSKIVTSPETLQIEEVNEENDVVVYNLILSDEDKGIVIGKSGRNIKSIRTLLSIIAKREGKLVKINIVD